MNKVVGIDPGQSGAAVCLDSDGTVMGGCYFSKSGEWFNIDDLCSFLMDCGLGTHVYIEKVHSMPKQGVASTFKFGTSFGMILGAVKAMKMIHTLVTPQAWTKELHKGLSKDIPAKERSIQVARSLFPCVDLLRSPRCKKPDEGFVDALLIAEYGRRQK